MFMTTPMAAVIMTGPGATAPGDRSLCTASQPMAPTAATSRTPFVTEAMMVALPMP